jgi:hypothetical protein
MASQQKTRERKHNFQCGGAADLLNGLLEAGILVQTSFSSITAWEFRRTASEVHFI